MNSNIKQLLIRYLLWGAVVAVMAVIFFHSAQNAEQSSQKSGSLVKTILSIIIENFEDIPEDEKQKMVEDLQFPIRKTTHFTIYALLGFLCYMAMNTYSVKQKTKIIVSGSISFTYAVTDEIHQLFVPGRAGQIRDVAIDFAGAVFGIFIALIFIYIFKKTIYRKRGSSL